MDMLGVDVSLDGTHYAKSYALAAARETLRIFEAAGMQRPAELGETRSAPVSCVVPITRDALSGQAAPA